MLRKMEERLRFLLQPQPVPQRVNKAEVCPRWACREVLLIIVSYSRESHGDAEVKPNENTCESFNSKHFSSKYFPPSSSVGVVDALSTTTVFNGSLWAKYDR